MNKLQLDVVSPEKIAFSAQVRQVTVPGADGQLTILPNHTSLFAKLTEGELIIVDEKKQHLIIGGGFLEVHQNKVVILVTRAVHQDELDEKEILKAKEQAEKAVSEALSEGERIAATALLHSHLLDLKVLRRRRRESGIQEIR